MLSSALRLFKTTTTKKNESTSTNTQVLQRAKRKKSSPWRTLSPTTYLCRLKHTFWNRKYLRWFITILFFFYFCQIWVGRISLLFVFESVCFSCLALTRCVHLNKEQQQVVLLWCEKPVFFLFPSSSVFAQSSIVSSPLVSLFFSFSCFFFFSHFFWYNSCYPFLIVVLRFTYVCAWLYCIISLSRSHIKKGSYLFEVSQVNRRHLPLFYIYLYSTAFSQFFLIGFFLSLCCSE